MILKPSVWVRTQNIGPCISLPSSSRGILSEKLTVVQLLNKISFFLWNPKFPRRVHNRLPLDCLPAEDQSFRIFHNLYYLYFIYIYNLSYYFSIYSKISQVASSFQIFDQNFVRVDLVFWDVIAYLCKWLPTFQRNAPPASLGLYHFNITSHL